jgi:DNA ligase-1
MRLSELVATSRTVSQTSSRLAKIAHLAELIQRVPPDELQAAIAFLSGSPRQGRIGLGGAAVAESRTAVPVDAATLEIGDVDARFDRIAAASGPGSAADKAQLLRELLTRATRDEQDFLARLIFGELRQGALEGLLIEAVARASKVPAAHVRRAAMLAGDLASVARAALTEGGPALNALVIRPFQPVQPMLAQSAADVGEALADLGEALLEYKIDGARIQVHKSGDEVRVFSRNLRDVTAAVPEVVDVVRAAPARELILDGEAVALRHDGTPEPFQITMRRFGRKLDVDRLRESIPISPFFFDALYVDGDSLIDEPLTRRTELMDRLTPSSAHVPRIVTASPQQAQEFAKRAIAAGHEGVMAKAVGGTYAAGRRGRAWVKVKQARTLDLVVLAVEWGSGRRKGMLSNLHLGARDQDRGGFVMLGKTFKGLTDELLTWQTKTFLELEIARDAYTVFVRPELVVEIAFNEIQESPQYPGRLALRFARVKRYRTDKSAAEADTLHAVQAIYTQQTGLAAPLR